ncbi:MAG: hypothetical protein WCO10_03705 [bacterium]
MLNSKKTKKYALGFTLIEAAIYLAIAGSALYYISGFTFNSIFGKTQIDTTHEVSDNSKAVLDEISAQVEDAIEVNAVSSPN